MMILKEITDKKNWNTIVNTFDLTDIYFTYDYFTPFKNNGDGEPILYYYQSDDGKVAYPFMYRDVAKDKKLAGKVKENLYFDISSVYGYGGPLFQVNEPDGNLEQLKTDFFEDFTEYCHQKNIISQFDRFHPLMDNHLFFDQHCDLSAVRKTIYMDLSDPEEMKRNLEHNCRNKIKQAEKNGVSVIVGDDFNTLKDFKELYKTTMQHNSAVDYYYFNEAFFDDTLNSMKDHILLVNAYFEEVIIASALILFYGNHVHNLFSGSNRECNRLKPNNLLFYEIAKWGSANGYKKYHLGGGYESDVDSLYKFKKSFSKLDPTNFYIGKKIYDPEIYHHLLELENNDESIDNHYFPQYR
ncbi:MULTISPECIES: lipid II:glycine glycyltransferase FemX [Carnobacterium]|uniref:Lipid II:glycine glycyltransferase FemX n=1 Tax=Carnobacterium antarcticum TaxID=2126436 RepID=A0ABW4NQW8_9LACT|nr:MULTISPECIES: GNAT family N-acetyltransferase [unclassified Carnobacterium]ALV21393.1 hypothetical protein NY10_778 [Carnobacterium sp. CP1]QQP69404.1 GNAT family N-acetyltransferase [Carnobacterium sp. CS13]